MRLAQQLAQSMAASEVPPEEWSRVLQFLKVIIGQNGAPPSDDGGARSFDDVEKH